MPKLTKAQWAGVAGFLAAVFVVVPMLIAASGRTDLYYTLTSVALLSIAVPGVVPASTVTAN